MDQNPTPLQKVKIQYCMMLVSGKFLSSDKAIEVDLGDNKSLLDSYDKTLMEATIRVRELYNIVDALNYMATIGWQFVETIVSDTASGTSLGKNKYLMKYT